MTRRLLVCLVLLACQSFAANPQPTTIPKPDADYGREVLAAGAEMLFGYVAYKGEVLNIGEDFRGNAEDWANLAKLDLTTTLSLDRSKISADELKAIAKMPAIKLIFFRSGTLDAAAIKILSTMPRLEVFNFNPKETNPTISDFKTLRQVGIQGEHLKSVEVTNCPQLTALHVAVRGQKAGRYVDMPGDPKVVQWRLEKLPALADLSIDQQVCAGLDLAQLPKLRSLTLSGNVSWKDPKEAAFAPKGGLESLTLIDEGIPAVLKASLDNSATLRSIRWSSSDGQRDAKEIFKTFPKLPNLRHLELSSLEIRTNDLFALDTPNLEELRLSDCTITGDVPASTAHMPALRWIRTYYSTMPDAFQKFIQQFNTSAETRLKNRANP